MKLSTWIPLGILSMSWFLAGSTARADVQVSVSINGNGVNINVSGLPGNQNVTVIAQQTNSAGGGPTTGKDSPIQTAADANGNLQTADTFPNDPIQSGDTIQVTVYTTNANGQLVPVATGSATKPTLLERVAAVILPWKWFGKADNGHSLPGTSPGSKDKRVDSSDAC